MFGRQATLPIDIELRTTLAKDVADAYMKLEEPNMDELVKERVRRLVRRLEEAKNNYRSILNFEPHLLKMLQMLT